MSAPRVVTELAASGPRRVAVLTLNRPEQRNPLDHDTIKDLAAALATFEASLDVSVVVITGSGTSFSAGGDLKAYRDLYRQPEAFASFLGDFGALCERLQHGRLISIAMVNGVCVAGGLELVLSCDLTLMAAEALIGDGHLRFGQLPGAGGSQRLPRAIGNARARVWMLTGQLYSAEDARVAGLVAEVVPGQELRARTMQLADEISTFSPLATRLAKDLLNQADEMPLDEGLRAERAIVHRYATESFDATEGLRTFADRQAPRYRGR